MQFIFFSMVFFLIAQRRYEVRKKCFLNHTSDPLAFEHRYGNLTILEFFSKWVKVMLPYREGGRAAWCRGWGQSDDLQCRLCYHPKERIQICDGFWTTQVLLIFKTGHSTQVRHTLRFTHLKHWNWKFFEFDFNFSWFATNFQEVMQKTRFFKKNLQYFLSKSVHGYLTMRCVK